MFERPPATPKKKNYYEFFGIPQNANEEKIHRAYREKAKLYHPDVGGNTEMFKQLQDVYAILKDPKKRAAYDAAIRPKVIIPPRPNPRNRENKPFRSPQNPNNKTPNLMESDNLFRDMFGWGPRGEPPYNPGNKTKKSK